MFDEPVPPVAGQLALPLDLGPAPDAGRRRSPTQWLGWTFARLATVFVWVSLPVTGVSVLLHLFPYHAKAAGISFEVQGTVLLRPGLSADTTFGSWQFPHVDGLPFGVHISPQDVDVFQLATAANNDGTGFGQLLQTDIKHQLGAIVWWLTATATLGALGGLVAAAAVMAALRYAAGHARRPWRWRRFGRQFAATVAVLGVVVAYGFATYNPSWAKRSRLTGTLGAAQLVPEQLEKFYNHQSKAYDVISAIAGIQAQLQEQIGAGDTAPVAFNVMYISDMHLASTYPLVAQYAKNFDAKLIVNTGDESEFGTAAELTDTYIDEIKSITASIPMVWVAGNHDSPATVDQMRAIPGVIVLGGKTRNGSDIDVSAQSMHAYGLTLAGVPDPRVYGADGVYGSDKASETDPLERKATDTALRGVAKTAQFDILATHEPVAAAEAVKDLPGRIRQTNSGHLHKQNSDGDIQSGSVISLVEGSTGAGGLDAISAATSPPPVEFSIESVATDCQFTRLVRFQLQGPALPASDVESALGQNVKATTIYLKPQKVSDDRSCTLAAGLSDPADLP